VTLFDHILATALASACVAQLFASIDASKLDRATLYKAGAASGLLFGGVPLLAWRLEGRTVSDFGLYGWGGGGLPALAAGAVWTAGLLLSFRLVEGGKWRETLTGYYRRFDWIMPRDEREVRASWAVSLVAGCGEEIAFRGFLLWYLAGQIGLLAAILTSSLIFGAAHSYQKKAGMVFATVAGLVLGLAYVASGSLPLVMWIHVTWNMASFAVGRMLLSPQAPENKILQ
jgi:membrane protease YdiL (CAAX protease family)